MVIPLKKSIQSKPHSPPYMMHKFWARRPHNVFSELVSHYTQPGEIVLDPFCGGGVTVVEGLQLKRKVVGVDVNPLATYVTGMEVAPVNVDRLYLEYETLYNSVGREILQLYKTECRNCGDEAICDWIEWKDAKPVKLAYTCSSCHLKEEALPSQVDMDIAEAIEKNFSNRISTDALWFPTDNVPEGDKTSGLIANGIKQFNQLFTKRNLLAFSLLWNAINKVQNEESRSFLRFTASSALKWVSRQSHRRENIIEGWAMHAYWIYPVELELNVWNTFARRFVAVRRGKQFTNLTIGDYYKNAQSFDDLIQDYATCLILNQSSTNLPIEDGKIDAVITDPPYGGNVNYGELSDYWNVWHRFNNKGIMDKSQEAVVNSHQKKTLLNYESLLQHVFSECYRVLKPDGVLVLTFNNKELGVVASFIEAISKAGFSVHPDGLLYQPPIKAYSTAFHARDLGAFTGDFIFTLHKENIQTAYLATDLDSIKHKLNETISDFVRSHQIHRHSQADLRQQLYQIIIPLLSDYAHNNHHSYWDVVRELSQQLGSLDELLPEISTWCRNRYQY